MTDTDSATGRARPLVAVGYGPRCVPVMQLAEAAAGRIFRDGVPLGIKVSRRETSANLGVAVMLVLGYYFLTTAVSWIDRHPEYRPDLLLWVPNLIFIGIGLSLFARMGKK